MLQLLLPAAHHLSAIFVFCSDKLSILFSAEMFSNFPLLSPSCGMKNLAILWKMTGEAKLKTKSVCLFSALPEFVAVSGWLQCKLWRGPQLQAIVYHTDHCNYSRACQTATVDTPGSVCACLFCYIVRLVIWTAANGRRESWGGGVGYQCLPWLCTKRLLCFSQLAIINGEDRDPEEKNGSDQKGGKGGREVGKNEEKVDRQRRQKV